MWGGGGLFVVIKLVALFSCATQYQEPPFSTNIERLNTAIHANVCNESMVKCWKNGVFPRETVKSFPRIICSVDPEAAGSSPVRVASYKPVRHGAFFFVRSPARDAFPKQPKRFNAFWWSRHVSGFLLTPPSLKVRRL